MPPYMRILSAEACHLICISSMLEHATLYAYPQCWSMPPYMPCAAAASSAASSGAGGSTAARTTPPEALASFEAAVAAQGLHAHA